MKQSSSSYFYLLIIVFFLYEQLSTRFAHPCRDFQPHLSVALKPTTCESPGVMTPDKGISVPTGPAFPLSSCQNQLGWRSVWPQAPRDAELPLPRPRGSKTARARGREKGFRVPLDKKEHTNSAPDTPAHDPRRGGPSSLSLARRPARRSAPDARARRREGAPRAQRGRRGLPAHPRVRGREAGRVALRRHSSAGRSRTPRQVQRRRRRARSRESARRSAERGPVARLHGSLAGAAARRPSSPPPAQIKAPCEGLGNSCLVM